MLQVTIIMRGSMLQVTIITEPSLFAILDLHLATYMYYKHFSSQESLCLMTIFPLYHYRVIVLESRPTDQPEAASNLYVLAGHENTY